MNRYLLRGLLVLVPCLAAVGYYAWAEKTKQDEMAALRNREVSPPPVVEPLESETAAVDEEEPDVELTADEILGLAEERWGTIDDYHCTTVVFLGRGEETDNKVLDVVFKKPNLYRNTVVEGDNQGAVATINPEGVIHGKQGGLLSMIVLTLEPEDERLTGLRGRRFFETAWGVEYQEVRDAVAGGWELTRLEDQELDGDPCYVVAATGESEDTDMTQRQIWIDQETHLPRRLYEFAGDDVVRDAKFINVELNTNPGKETFTLK